MVALRNLLLVAAPLAASAFLAPLPPARAPVAASQRQHAVARGRTAPLRMSSLFLDENALADRIKDGLLIRYLPEVRK